MIEAAAPPTGVRGRPRELCPACGGARHRHGVRVSSDFDCYWRQFATHKRASKGLPLTPALLREFADWLQTGVVYRRPTPNEYDQPPERAYF